MKLLKICWLVLVLLCSGMVLADPPVVVDYVADNETSGDEELQFVLPGGAPDDGDLLMMVSQTGGFSTRYVQTPDGWTETYEIIRDGTWNFQVFTRFASGDDDTFDFTLTGATTNSGGVLMRITGAANPLVIDEENDITQSDRTAIISPAITPTVEDSLVFRIVSATIASGTITTTGTPDPPTGTTRILHVGSSNAIGKFVIDRFTHGTTSTGTETYQDSVVTSNPAICLTMALAPEASPLIPPTGLPYVTFPATRPGLIIGSGAPE